MLTNTLAISFRVLLCVCVLCPHNTNTTPNHWNVQAYKFHIANRPSHSRSQKAISRSILHWHRLKKSTIWKISLRWQGHILELQELKSIMEVLSVLKRGFIMISLTMLDCCRVVMAQTTFSAKYNVKLWCGIGKFKVFFSFKVLGRRKKNWNYLSCLPVKNVFLFILISLFAPEMCKNPVMPSLW